MCSDYLNRSVGPHIGHDLAGREMENIHAHTYIYVYGNFYFVQRKANSNAWTPSVSSKLGSVWSYMEPHMEPHTELHVELQMDLHLEVHIKVHLELHAVSGHSSGGAPPG